MRWDAVRILRRDRALGAGLVLQPLGAVALVAAGLVVLRAAVGHLRGRWLGVDVTLSRRVARGLYVSICVALLALDVRQQVIADVLR
ncbi:MAG: hypothetical protein BGO37_13935 [Cellulomonas sp. 73-92]|nr:MAG: hypothetical protein BGO37_13935 [Cellulomonas sp. 73-92]